MNRKIQILGLVVICLIFTDLTWAQLTFERIYGGKFYDVGNNVIETPDHHFIILGTTRSFSNDTTDAYVIRINENGDTLWTNTYGGRLWDSGVALAAASDEGYILAIASNSIKPGNYDIYLEKIQGNGDTVWTKNYGGPSTEYVHSIQSTNDQGFIILAHTLSYGIGAEDFYLLKVDQNGDSLWSRTYGGARFDWGGFVQQTADEGYILTGETQSFQEPFGDVYLIKTDSVGNTLWTRTYGGAEFDRAVHVLQTPDGGYLLSGSTQSFGAADQNGYIIKTNSMGDTLWTKVLGGAHTCSILYCQQTSDGNHVAVGYISETGFGKSDVYIIKFDPSGNILWTRNFGGADNDVGHCINETQDGGLIIVGGTKSFSSDQNNDLYLIKTNGAGNLTQINETQSTPLPASVGLLTCYPNPFNSSTKLIFNLNKAENVSLKIFNLLGKEIETLLSEKYMTAGEHEMIWTADHLASGLYVCQLKTGQRVFTKKLLYQK